MKRLFLACLLWLASFAALALPPAQQIVIFGGVSGGSGSSPFLLLDNFSRYTNNTVMSGQMPVTGPSWLTTGASLPTTQGGLLVNSSLGYLYVDLPTTPQVLGAKLSFTGGTTMNQQNFAMALSSQTPGALQIKNLVHYNMGPVGCTVGIFDVSGNFTTLLNANWTTQLANNGTVYETYFGVINSTIVVVGPHGEQFAVTDPTIAPNYGPLAFWEPITESDGLSAGVSVAYATNNKIAFPNPDSLNPGLTTTTITLSNFNLTATGNSTSGTPQSLGTAPRTNGKVHFEFVKVSNVNDNEDGIGIASITDHALTTELGNDAKSFVFFPFIADTGLNLGGVFSHIGTNWVWQVGAVGAVEIDFGLMKAWLRQASPTPSGWNDDILANQNPATGVGGIDISGVNGAPFAAAVQLNGVGDAIKLNMGASPFAITPSAGFGPWLFLLKRDIDPASNDNGPMWLEKAA